MEKQVPTLFIFDEPTTGLHFHDIKRLLTAFDALIERGHTIVVIEHNMDVICMADHIIDLGPEGGAAGGNVVVAGTPAEVAACPQSYTGQYILAHVRRYAGTQVRRYAGTFVFFHFARGRERLPGRPVRRYAGTQVRRYICVFHFSWGG